MRKVLIGFVCAAGLALGTAVPAFADHNAGPCNESGEPGNSDYAAHHIVPVAKAGNLGAGGHIPGDHQGFSSCIGD